MFRKIGKGAGVVGVGLAGLGVLQANNKARAVTANIGAGLGGIVGGAVGATAGAATGPAAVMAAPADGLAGGRWGYDAGEAVYDYIDKLRRQNWIW